MSISIDDDSANDDDSNHDQLNERGDIVQVQTVLDDRKNQYPQNDPEDLSLSSTKGDPSNDSSRYGVQFAARPHIGGADTPPGRQNGPRGSGEKPADRIGERRNRPNLDSRKPGRFSIAAQSVRISARRRSPQEQVQNRKPESADKERERDPPDVAVSQVQHAVGNVSVKRDSIGDVQRQPRTVVIMAKVTTNAFTLHTEMMIPLASPTSPPTRMAAMIPGMTPATHTVWTMQTLVKAMTEPTATSTPPAMRTTACPHANRARGAACLMTFWMLIKVAKRGSSSAKTMTRTTRKIKSPH